MPQQHKAAGKSLQSPQPSSRDATGSGSTATVTSPPNGSGILPTVNRPRGDVASDLVLAQNPFLAMDPSHGHLVRELSTDSHPGGMSLNGGVSLRGSVSGTQQQTGQPSKENTRTTYSATSGTVIPSAMASSYQPRPYIPPGRREADANNPTARKSSTADKMLMKDDSPLPLEAMPANDLPRETSHEIGLSRSIVVTSDDGHPVSKQMVIDAIVGTGADGPPGKHIIIEKDNHVFLRFTNLQRTLKFLLGFADCHPRYQATPISPLKFAHSVGLFSNLTTLHEGEVYIVAWALGTVTDGWNLGERIVKDLLQAQGTVLCFKRLSGPADMALTAVAEFSDVEISFLAVARLHGLVRDGIHINMSLHRPDVNLMPSPVSQNALPVMPRRQKIASSQGLSVPGGVQDLSTALQEMALVNTHSHQSVGKGKGPMVHQPVPYYSVAPLGMGPSMKVGMLGHNQAGGMSSSARYLPGPVDCGLLPYGVGGRFNNRRGGSGLRSSKPREERGNNHVDIQRIQDGLDVRTTIMIRNIPNKVDQPLLKEIMDESSWGQYDFMYLRIDFQNDCNVGYAFVNFVDPLDIVGFVNARGKQRWNCFRSDKVAEISYATIQGRDCLVQKFRNSSVMLELPHYRPKLYFTIHGADPEKAGVEEAFPEPDNVSKMKRSVENAEHIGLFTPNANRDGRNHERPRRTNWDRGTAQAAIEGYGATQSAIAFSPYSESHAESSVMGAQGQSSYQASPRNYGAAPYPGGPPGEPHGQR